ncbi:type IX secretion system periplasmic lipoprotein PorW/SprE [Luteirhabdus pelagi]
MVGAIAACSRKKNTFMSRNYHAVTAEYNALYNGQVAFQEGKQELAQTYRDNFWEILPVERIQLDEASQTPGTSGNPKFDRAEEKAAKAIQKHSVYVDGKEYNPQIDESYMLLGKARYYSQRFIPALDAFNFILDRYPTSNNINNAKIWKAKSYIRLRNEEVALENLQEIFEKEQEELEDEVIADAAAIMAQAYINLDSLPEALPYMKMASENAQDNELKGRYLYIKGQLYNRLELRDSANMAFDEVIELNRKSPRVYMINAYIAKARNFDYDNEDKVAFLELLRELEENRENRPFLDKIYNQIGEYYRNTKNIDTAITYYNKSIAAFTNDQTLQARNYKTLAEIYFDNAEYKDAGAYYDSTLMNTPENTREHRRITKKRENLDDVIKYEDIAIKNDSILRLTAMSEADRRAYFVEYTNELRQQAIEDSIAQAKEEQAIANKEFYTKESSGRNKPGGAFYFYNPTTVAYGLQEFKNIWGNRKLEDNWRRSSKKTISIDEAEEEVVSVPISEDARFNPDTYLEKIPTEQTVIDSLAKDRNFAYYQLGLIYKEKFKEPELASNRLEKLLTFNPEERLVLPSKYNLFKIYEETNKPTLAEKYKNDILTNHADSRYAEILRNPNTALANDESSPEYKYNQLYKKFEAAEYEKVISKSDEYITLYNGTDMVPKFEMLKATALGRQKGFEAYKEALNYVALNYPSSKEGKQAEEIYAQNLPQLAQKEFIPNEASEKWNVAYRFTIENEAEAQALKEKLDEAIADYNYTNMSTSVDYYDPSTRLVVIHGLNTKMGGRGFAEVLKDNKKYKINKPFFEISSENYKIIQVHKNLEDYLNRESTTEEVDNPQK